MIFKKKVGYDDLELNHLMAVREMWRAAKSGMRVCVVSKFLISWEDVLGRFYDVVSPFVESGLIYLKVENHDDGEYALSVDDLDNTIVEICEAV